MIFLNRSRLAEQAAHIFKYEACKLSLEKQNTNNFSVEKKRKKPKGTKKIKQREKSYFSKSFYCLKLTAYTYAESSKRLCTSPIMC